MLLSSAFRFAVIAALVCITAIFFCPAAAGPYATTHGPVTAFRARQLAFIIFSLLLGCATVVAQAIPIMFGLRSGHSNLNIADLVQTANERLSLCCSLLC